MDGRRERVFEATVDGLQACQRIDGDSTTSSLIQDAAKRVIVRPAAQLAPITCKLRGTKIVLGMGIRRRIMKPVCAETADQQLILIGNQDPRRTELKMQAICFVDGIEIGDRRIQYRLQCLLGQTLSGLQQIGE